MLDVLKDGHVHQVAGLAEIHKGDLFRPSNWPGPPNLWQRAADEPRRVEGVLCVNAPFDRVAITELARAALLKLGEAKP